MESFCRRIFSVTVQPSPSLLPNPAHLKFAFSKGLDSWLNLHTLTDFAKSAKSWAELLLFSVTIHSLQPLIVTAFVKSLLHGPVQMPKLSGICNLSEKVCADDGKAGNGCHISGKN